MENSEVLEQDTTVPKDGPVQKDVAPVQNDFIGSIQTKARVLGTSSTQPVVGEKDHATDIMNNTEMNKTYNYNSQAEKEYDESINTTTVQSTGANMSATWDAEYKMGSDYTAKEGEDYSWNKLASDMAQLSYDQEANQYRAESIAAKQEIDAAASQAWNNYFAAEYSARQTQDKMGWSGGQKQASDLQVSFLQAETAANMYTQDEMQRYGVESKLSVARMYADANQKALALQYYQDEIDKAVSEANLTGWYIPPEASEMFKQQDLAKKILEDTTSTQAAKDRAKNIIANCNKYYEELGFQRGYAKDENGNIVTDFYGIKCLSMLQHEETVRNNKINEELQKEANDISQKQLNATRESISVQRQNVTLLRENQNYIETVNILDKGQHLPSKDGDNYYMDDNGKKHSIPSDGTDNLVLYNDTWYYKKMEGTKHKVYKAYNVGTTTKN